MPKFKVQTEWSGYSRGTVTYLVEAKDEESAKETWYDGEEIERDVVRDDTENEIVSVTKV